MRYIPFIVFPHIIFLFPSLTACFYVYSLPHHTSMESFTSRNIAIMYGDCWSINFDSTLSLLIQGTCQQISKNAMRKKKRDRRGIKREGDGGQAEGDGKKVIDKKAWYIITNVFDRDIIHKYIRIRNNKSTCIPHILLKMWTKTFHIKIGNVHWCWYQIH